MPDETTDPFAGANIDLQVTDEEVRQTLEDENLPLPPAPQDTTAQPEAPADVATTEETPEPPPVVSWLRDRGHDLSDDVTEQDLDDYLIGLQEQASEAETLRARLRELESRQPEPESKSPTQTPEESQPKSLLPERPEWNAAWSRYVELGPTGQYQLTKEGRELQLDPSIAAKADAYAKYLEAREQAMDRFFTDPQFRAEVLGLEDRFRELGETVREKSVEELRREVQHRDEQSELDRWAEQHRDHLWNRDGRFTRLGTLLNDRVRYHRERGIGPRDAIRYAESDVEQTTGRRVPWAEGEKPQTPGERKIAFTNRMLKRREEQRIDQPPVKRAPAGSEHANDHTFSNANMERIIRQELSEGFAEQI